jgi:hypothetical protein
MATKPWEHSGSFHIWFIEQVDAIVEAGPPTIRVGGRNRPLDEEDFGYTSKTLSEWRKEIPKQDFPDGRKMLDIVASTGFKQFKSEHQNAILNQWIAVELDGQSHELTDELVGLLFAIVEKSSADFLMQCWAESQN